MRGSPAPPVRVRLSVSRAARGAAPFGDGVATVEAYVPGGALLPGAGRSAWAFAGAFARLVTLAPRPAEVPALDPPPSWADWNHAGAGLWPPPEDPDVNLNEVAGPAWIDDTGRRARDRLRAGASEAVIGHCDWLAANLRRNGDKLLVVHDWDSVTADSEAVLAGFAAALYSAVSVKQLATVRKRSGSSWRTARRTAGNSARTNSNGRGQPVPGPGPTKPGISTRSGNPSAHSPRMRLVNASAVPRSANGGAIGANVAGCSTCATRTSLTGAERAGELPAGRGSFRSSAVVPIAGLPRRLASHHCEGLCRPLTHHHA